MLPLDRYEPLPVSDSAGQPVAISADDEAPSGAPPKVSAGEWPLDADEPWDLGSAEALMLLYERELGGRARDAAVSAGARGRWTAPGLEVDIQHPRHAHGALAEDRPTESVSRLEQLISEVSAPAAAEALARRFDAFEAHVGSLLQEVATRAELERLQGLPAQLDALAAELDAARPRLDRLPEIEAHMGAVLQLLSEDRLGALLEKPRARTGEEVARALAGFSAERRESDAQLAAMLDTMQQALVRILDRIDAYALGEQRPLANEIASSPVDDPAVAATATGVPPDEAPETERFIPDPPQARDHEPAEAAGPSEPLVGAAPELCQPRTPMEAGTRATIEKIRQELIADAHRAKLRAEAEADAARPSPAATAKPWIAGRIAARATAAQVKGMPLKRLIGIALGLLVVIQAANLLLARRAAVPERPVAASARVSEGETAPAPAEGAGSSDPALSTAGEQPPAPGGAAQRSSLENPVGASAAVIGAEPPQSAAETAEGLDLQPNALSGADGLDSNAGTAAPLPAGIALERSAASPTAEEIARVHSRRRMASLSTKLGASAAGTYPAAWTSDEAATDGEAPGTSLAPKLADMPPATVGPLSLRLAAANGVAAAEFEVGARFAEGRGPAQSFEEAARWYQRAAARGFAQAQYRLGTLYERGLGVPRELARAGVWYRRAAEQGSVNAMHNIAVLSTGQGGTVPDYASAAKWFGEAAERGLADSQFNLAVLHENGLGVPKNIQLAYRWFSLAARSGDAEAIRRRDEVKARLTAADLAAADESASAWRAKPVDALVNDAHVAGEAWKKDGPSAKG